MIINFNSFISEDVDLKKYMYLSSEGKKEIIDIDINFINKLSLFFLNMIKYKYRKGFNIPEPSKYFRNNIFDKINAIYICVDKNLIDVDGYFIPYKEKNNRYVLQLMIRKPDLNVLHHEIQHMIDFIRFGHDFDEFKTEEDYIDIIELLNLVNYNKDMYCFIHCLYLTDKYELLAFVNNVYYELKFKKKTNKDRFESDLNENEEYLWYSSMVNRNQDDFIEKLNDDPNYRIEFFSALNYILSNMEKKEKIKKYNKIEKLLNFNKRKLGIKYDKKLNQKEADELTEFWLNYFEKRGETALQIINNMKDIL